MEEVSIGDFLSNEQIQSAVDIWHKVGPDGFYKEFLKDIIEPNIAQINDMLGQENDPAYLARAVEFAIGCVLTFSPPPESMEQ